MKRTISAGYGIVIKGFEIKSIGSVDFNHRHEDSVLEISYTLPRLLGSQAMVKASAMLIDLAFKNWGFMVNCLALATISESNVAETGFTLPKLIERPQNAQGNRVMIWDTACWRVSKFHSMNCPMISNSWDLLKEFPKER